jgi:hypothetical protein
MTTENNKLIAEFIGYNKTTMNNGKKELWTIGSTSDDKNYFEFVDGLKFHTDWNWLMEVVEKIESLGSSKIMNTILYSRFEVKHNRVLLYWNKDNNYQIKIETLQDWQKGYKSTSYKDYRRVDINKDTTKLEAIYLVCVEFIKWYNENKI